MYLITAVLSCVAATAYGIPQYLPTPTPSDVPSEDAVATLKDTLAHLGKDKDHPYIIPYCGAGSINISTENAFFVPHTDGTNTAILPDDIDLLLVDLKTSFDLTPYQNSLGTMLMDVEFPAEHPEWAQEFNITGVLFTSNTSVKADAFVSTDPAKRIVMEMAFTFMVPPFNVSSNETDYIAVMSPSVRIAVPQTNTTASSDDDLLIPTGGTYAVELGYMVSHGPNVQLDDISFSDIYVSCLDAPTESELAAENMTYWKKEVSPNVWEFSPAMQAEL